MQSLHSVHGAADECCVTNLWGLDYPVWVAYLDWRIANISTPNDDDNDSIEGRRKIYRL